MRPVPFLILLPCLVRVCCADGWVERADAGPFEIRSEFALQDLSGLVEEIENLETDLETVLGLTIEPEPIQLSLFATSRSYRAYMSRHVPIGINRRAIYTRVDGQNCVYAVRGAEFSTDIRHECTHALLHSVLPFVPLWLDEGLAEYFEVEPRRRIAGHSHLRSLRWSVRFFWRPNLARLERHRDMASLGRSEYRESWAWVHFLLHESVESRRVLEDYLGQIERGVPPGSLSERVFRQMPDADVRLVRHLSSWGKLKRDAKY